MFSSAVESTYNIDTTLGYLLGHGAIPAVAMNPLTASTINLDHLNLHDAIEHDASLSREDQTTGDNHSLQPKLLQAMLDDAPGDYLTVESIAKTRARREKESLNKGSPKIGFKAYTLAYGEAALMMIAMGKATNGSDYQVAKKDIKAWFGEEKLPEGYVKPATAVSLSAVSGLSNTIGNMAQKIGAASVKNVY